MPLIRFALVPLCLTLLMSSCDNDSGMPEQADKTDFVAVRPIPDYLQNGLPDYVPPSMLSVGNKTAPEDWLLALHLQYDKNSDRQPEYYQQRLQQIEPYVHDTSRVIANRTVQISRQLAELGIPIAVDKLLTDFAAYLTDNFNRQRYVYGDLCAQYVNLRRQGENHQNAMRFLFNSQSGLAG